MIILYDDDVDYVHYDDNDAVHDNDFHFDDNDDDDDVNYDDNADDDVVVDGGEAADSVQHPCLCRLD